MKGKESIKENFDFISKNIFVKNKIVQNEIQRRKITMVSLGVLYLTLTIISILVLV